MIPSSQSKVTDKTMKIVFGNHLGFYVRHHQTQKRLYNIIDRPIRTYRAILFTLVKRRNYFET